MYKTARVCGQTGGGRPLAEYGRIGVRCPSLGGGGGGGGGGGVGGGAYRKKIRPQESMAGTCPSTSRPLRLALEKQKANAAN